jgi:hypothetical protein
MINIKISEKSKRKLFYQPYIIKKNILNSALLANNDIGSFLNKKIKESIKKDGGTGKTYTRYINGNKMTKKSSGYGDAPVSWTGKLKRSNNYKINLREITIYNTAPYAKFLETKKGGAPAGKRVFMINKINKYKQYIPKLYDQRISKEINKINNGQYW